MRENSEDEEVDFIDGEDELNGYLEVLVSIVSNRWWGHQVAARELAKRVHDCLYYGDPNQMPEVLRQWLVDALREVATGSDANKALGLSGKRGRPQKHYERLHILVLHKIHRDQGMTYESAISAVAQLMSLDDETIRTHLKRR